MNADDTTPTPDDAVERFATAVDGDAAPGAADPELAREMEIVALLSRQGAALDPDPETRARARSRLLAALADAARMPDDGPSRAS